MLAHPGWRQTRTVVVMDVKRRQRGDLPFSAADGLDDAPPAAKGGAGADSGQVWAALRRSLNSVR